MSWVGTSTLLAKNPNIRGRQPLNELSVREALKATNYKGMPLFVACQN